jgi:hypothetical protein
MLISAKGFSCGMRAAFVVASLYGLGIGILRSALPPRKRHSLTPKGKPACCADCRDLCNTLPTCDIQARRTGRSARSTKPGPVAWQSRGTGDRRQREAGKPYHALLSPLTAAGARLAACLRCRPVRRDDVAGIRRGRPDVPAGSSRQRPLVAGVLPGSRTGHPARTAIPG